VLLFAFTHISHADNYYGNPLSPQNVAYKPNPESESVPLVLPASSVSATHVGQHGIRSTDTISEARLRQYLEAEHSPLAPLAAGLLDSPYWSTIIAICTIEEYSCSVNPYGSNNFWGLMANGHLLRFDSVAAGLAAENTFLEHADDTGRDTIESLNCWYVVPCSDNWIDTVLRTKAAVEAL